MSYGASVREVRAMEIGVAAAHFQVEHRWGFEACTCSCCQRWGERVRAAAGDKDRVGALPDLMAVGMVALCDELRREADERERCAAVRT